MRIQREERYMIRCYLLSEIMFLAEEWKVIMILRLLISNKKGFYTFKKEVIKFEKLFFFNSFQSRMMGKALSIVLK